MIEKRQILIDCVCLCLFRELEAMVIAKWQVGFFLVIVLSALREDGKVLCIKYFPRKLAEIEETQVWRRTTSFIGGDFFGTSKRQVPSSPDPLHNR